jgi:hypothetical protein
VIARRKRLLRDTNVLLLWLVALTNPKMLFEFKRVQSFSYRDIVLLRDIVARCAEHLTTPHVLAETTNFVRQAPAHRRPLLLEAPRVYIDEAAEVYRPAKVLARRAEFLSLGLSDAGLFELGSDAVVVTTDHRLAAEIANAGGDSIHFEFGRP